MKEVIKIYESIEQKQAFVSEWIKDISEKQTVKEMPTHILKEVLESYGANFEDLSEEGKKGLSMYNEKKRSVGMKEIWGEKWIKYTDWTEKNVDEYESESDKKLQKMGNVPDLINEERKASGKKNMGMVSFLSDITAYASQNLTFEDFKLFMEARAENGVVGAMTLEEKGDRKKRIIEWDREIDPEKGPLTKDPRESRIHLGKFVAEDKQEIRPASFPPCFPIKAIEWIKNN